MEYLWLILASLGAGVGTGLAGLSAATVMVPVLIVLCPSFAGETGAYQATAIALASDILGSAVTTVTYARHKNIDLKRGWIMLVCIRAMCTVGSYVAWLAGNIVLGSFTLFLTLFIGIRFLVKPDSSRRKPAKKGQKLNGFGIAVSLFFGLTIGFGTGFVGTGGGMMMLIVFTAFLGMELKPAVGTSTFIMTFTALIASVSHIFIHPAILLERWDALLICIGVATFASLLSAQFANRVKNRTVGLVTGAVLTLLGGSMLILHYWGTISQWPVVMQTLRCLGLLIAFFIPCVLLLIPLRLFTKIPSFIFRKMLHVVAFTSITIMTLLAESWLAATLVSVIIAVALFPLLMVLEKKPWFARFFVQKKPGEIKLSLLMLFFTFAAITAFTWGIFGKPHIVAAAILMWGTGDAAAALVGIPFGKHKVRFKPVNGKKSWEGTGSMFVVSLLCGFFVLLFAGGVPFGWAALMAVLGALVAAGVELFSPSELDTVTVPSAILVPLLFLSVPLGL